MADTRGEDVAKTIFAAAVDQQITQIVLGTSRLSRWQSMTRGSVIQTLLRMASDNDIDVHVIARRDDAAAVVERRTTTVSQKPRDRREAASAARRAACLHATVEVGESLGPARVAGQVLGHRDRVGGAVWLAQPEHGLVDDALVRSVTDAAIDRPVDAGFLADLGHAGRLHVDRAEALLEDGSPDFLVVEEPVGRHQAPRRLSEAGSDGCAYWGPSG